LSHWFGNRKGEKAKANSTFSPLSLLDRLIYSAVLMTVASCPVQLDAVDENVCDFAFARSPISTSPFVRAG